MFGPKKFQSSEQIVEVMVVLTRQGGRWSKGALCVDYTVTIGWLWTEVVLMRRHHVRA